MSLSTASSNFLYDHSIENQVVFPFVCVADSLFRKLKSQGKEQFKIINLKLCRGIILEKIDDLRFYDWVIEEMECSLIGPDKTLHYKAEVEFGEQGSVCSIKPEFDCIASPYYPFVFHGPMLQSIVGYDLLKDEDSLTGAYAKIKTAMSMGWDNTDWMIDPAVADGALQLACFVTGAMKKKISLPVCMGKISVCKALNQGEEVICMLNIKSNNVFKHTSDIQIFDSQGLCYSFEDVQMCYKLKK